jgi:LysM repeat protein
MEPKPRRGRWIVRVGALLALVAAAVVIGVVVSSSLDGKDGDGNKKKDDGGTAVAGCQPEAEEAVELGYYVVQENDLLSLIAQRTCVPEDELVRLNPNVDPQNLEVGRCVNLEEQACENRAT